MQCPKCAFENVEFSRECARCGVVFSKRKTPHPRFAVPLPARGERVAEGRVRVVAIGFVLAVVAHLLWPARAALMALKTLFHEIGHAIAGWLLGHASIPAFDFMFGGGLTHYGQFRLSIALAVAAAFAYFAWRLRANKRAVFLIAVVFLVWLVCVSREWRRETVLASAGVIFELILAAVFLYMALSGRGWHIPEIERPLGAMIAFFVQFYSWVFAIRLIRDADFLEWYREGKGGALMNDLEIVALNLKIYLGMNTTIERIALWLFLFSFVPSGVALWCHFREEKVRALFESLAS